MERDDDETQHASHLTAVRTQVGYTLRTPRKDQSLLGFILEVRRGVENPYQ
jgi:hypothetical protein